MLASLVRAAITVYVLPRIENAIDIPQGTLLPRI